MKKASIVAILASASLGLTGCITASNSASRGEIPLAALSTTATYDVIGDAVGTSSGAMLFGIIPIGCENKIGQIGGGAPILNPVVGAAVYNAIESVPTADALLATRVSTKSKNYIIYKEDTVTVKGKAIRYNGSAK